LFIFLQFLLASAPLFLLIIKGWISTILFISSGLSLLLLYLRKKQGAYLFSKLNKWLFCFLFVFTLPTLAILISQLFLQELLWRSYDAPVRFLLSIPILLVLVQNKIDVLKILIYSIPFALVMTLICVALNPYLGWGADRITTYFVDPLTFGSLNLTLGIFCFLSLDLYQVDSWRVKIIKYSGFIIGLYLSILSGSRTGWLALPLLILIWMFFQRKKPDAFMSVIILLLISIGFFFSSVVQHRLGLVIQEITNYQWNSENQQTSIGDRISFLRMAVFLFLQKPLSGFGENGFAEFINHPELNKYAIEATQRFVLNALFHNEISTNTVKSGLWGLLSSSALFFVPAIFFIKKMGSTIIQIQRTAMLGFGYWTCTFISGMTTEVFNLKFTASFHALMLTFLISSLIFHINSNKETKKS
jgi:O-antigen ligase